MSIFIHIIPGPLPPQPVKWEEHAGHGALLTFEGVARPTENGDPIIALDYEAYEPMASKVIRRIGEELAARHGLISLSFEHSTGRVRIGECSFRLRIAAYHRKEALAAMNEFIDRLKQDVPIWKTPVYSATA